MTLPLHFMYGHLLTCSVRKFTNKVLLAVEMQQLAPLCASKSFLSASSRGCFTREEKQSAGEMGAVTRSLAGGKYFQA